MTLLEKLEKRAGIVSKGLGFAAGKGQLGAEAVGKAVKGHVIKAKADFRRGQESALGTSGKARRAENVQVQKGITATGDKERRQSFARKALTYGGIGLGAAALGGGAYAVHKYRKNKREQEQASYPSAGY